MYCAISLSFDPTDDPVTPSTFGRGGNRHRLAKTLSGARFAAIARNDGFAERLSLANYSTCFVIGPEHHRPGASLERNNG